MRPDDGMDLNAVAASPRQIAHQCRAALPAHVIGQKGLGANDQDVFWASAQNFLTGRSKHLQDVARLGFARPAVRG